MPEVLCSQGETPGGPCLPGRVVRGGWAVVQVTLAWRADVRLRGTAIALMLNTSAIVCNVECISLSLTIALTTLRYGTSSIT